MEVGGGIVSSARCEGNVGVRKGDWGRSRGVSKRIFARFTLAALGPMANPPNRRRIPARTGAMGPLTRPFLPVAASSRPVTH